MNRTESIKDQERDKSRSSEGSRYRSNVLFLTIALSSSKFQSIGKKMKV